MTLSSSTTRPIVPPAPTVLPAAARPRWMRRTRPSSTRSSMPPEPVLNAIFNATGARVTRIPATPDKVLAALKAL